MSGEPHHDPNLEPLPLANLRVWLTRPDALAAAWSAAGASVEHVPTVELRLRSLSDAGYVVLQRALARPSRLVFTSSNAVKFCERAVIERDPGMWAQWRGRPVAVVGPATAAAAHARGFLVDYIGEGTGADLGAALLESSNTDLLVWPGSDRRRPELEQTLRAGGREVWPVHVYHTSSAKRLPEPRLQQLRDGMVDAIAFYSPTAVRGLLAATDNGGVQRASLPPCACLGPTTARVARDAGLNVVAAASPPIEGTLLEAIAAWWATC